MMRAAVLLASKALQLQCHAATVPCLVVLQVNERKLPELDSKAGFGLRPPPDEHLIMQSNWRINANALLEQEQQGGDAMQQ